MTCRQTSFSMQSVPDPKVYFPRTSTPEGPQHIGPAPWGRMFHLFALLHLRHLHHQHQHPKIHMLLKLPQLNLSDAITQAHSTTFPHAVPNQHLHLFPIFYTLWSPPTIQNIFLKLLQLNLCWEGSIMQVHSNTRRPLFGLTKAFHVGGSTLQKLSHHAESSTTFNYFN